MSFSSDERTGSARGPGSTTSTAKRGRKTVPIVSDEALLLNLTRYAENHGAMFSDGGRAVPVTISALKHAATRRDELNSSDKKSRTRILRRETAEGRERKNLQTLFECFRVCPKLKLQPGQLIPSEMEGGVILDLDVFISLSSIEFVGCSLREVQNSPLGLKEVVLRRSQVPLRQLGEDVRVLSIDHCPPETMDGVAALASTLQRLGIKGSILPPLSLEDIVGKELWPALKSLKLKGNILDAEMLTPLRQMPGVVELSLARNGLKQIRNLERCTALVRLDLSGNEIASVEEAASLLPASLTSLNLERNRLVSLDGLTALNFTALKSLNVSDNHLRSWKEVCTLLSNNTQLLDLRVSDNAFLDKTVPFYRPLVAGMVEFERWKDFLLDGSVFTQDDTNKTTVKNTFSKYKHVLEDPEEEERQRPTVITTSPKTTRTRTVILGEELDTYDACLAAAVVVAAAASDVFAGDEVALDSTLGSTRGNHGKKPRKYKTVKKLVPRRKADKQVGATEDSASPVREQTTDLPPSTSPQEESLREDSLKEDSTTADEHKRNLARRLSLAEKPGFLESVAAKSLSDSTLDEVMSKVVSQESFTLTDPSIISSTTQSFRAFVSDVSDRLSALLNCGTIVPTLSRVVRHRWGPAKPAAGDGMQNAYRVMLFPPTLSRTSESRVVTVDACSAEAVLFVRVRAGNPRTAELPTGDEGWLDGSLGGGDMGGCPLASPDLHGFVPRQIEAFEGFGSQDPPSRPPANLCNVRTWEVGEPKLWDAKRVTVEPTPGAQYVTTNSGVTYLQRMQQAELRGSIHHTTDLVLLAGFEVPNEQSEQLFISMLRTRLSECRINPQWPVITQVTRSSAGDEQTFSFTHPPFKSELHNTELISQDELRAGSKRVVSTTTDVFMYFGSRVAGCRKPDSDAIEKYNIRVGEHILADHDAQDVYDGEQLVDSCYCNVLLGNASNENEEKSCWIAVSSTHTYFNLDVNHEGMGSKALQQPFVFLSCHCNHDLLKIEIGYGMQYMRLVYGGETGSTYLLLPRCHHATKLLLNLLTNAPGASKDGRITVHSSPFVSRQLFQGQGTVLGYFLVFMRQDQLVQRSDKAKDKDAYMSFPQDVYPLRELGCLMLPVSLIITKDDILVASDRYGTWPDGEKDPSRWHVEKRQSLGDVAQVCTAPSCTSLLPNRFAFDFESDDAEGSPVRWNFCAQTPAAVTDILSLVKREWETKWRLTLGFGDLEFIDEQPLNKKRKGW